MTDCTESAPRKFPRLSLSSKPHPCLHSSLSGSSLAEKESPKSRKRRQNRESEARARVRRKEKEEGLKRRMEELADENGRLGKEAERLRTESAALQRNLRFYQTLMATRPVQPSS